WVIPDLSRSAFKRSPITMSLLFIRPLGFAIVFLNRLKKISENNYSSYIGFFHTTLISKQSIELLCQKWKQIPQNHPFKRRLKGMATNQSLKQKNINQDAYGKSSASVLDKDTPK
ncbi:MAG: hypothetical protein K6C37_01415, partial [Bacteroidales bacterium]|nr:hypothetical protein [Bacteroidales bacterium]